jgi:hypothetical protein
MKFAFPSLPLLLAPASTNAPVPCLFFETSAEALGGLATGGEKRDTEHGFRKWEDGIF